MKRGVWIGICLSSEPVSKKSILNAMKAVFGKGLIDCLVLGEDISENCFQNYLDGYAFAFVETPIDKYHAKIRKNPLFGKIICNEEGIPTLFSEEEIAKMADSFKLLPKEDIKVGSCVVVREGLYANLKGIVTKRLESGLYEVMFRLYTRTIVTPIKGVNLTYIDHLSDWMKRTQGETKKNVYPLPRRRPSVDRRPARRR